MLWGDLLCVNKKEIEIRITKIVADQIRREIYKHGNHEYVVFALCNHAETAGKSLILVNEIISLKENDYVDSQWHGAMWRGASTIDILNKGIEEKAGIFLFHSHMHTGQVSLSADDLKSAYQLLPSYQNLIPDRPHGSIVLSYDCMAGIALMPDQNNFRKISRIRWIDRFIKDWDAESISIKKQKYNLDYENQVLLIGSETQHRLGIAKVAVIGLSGGGGHVCQQLAHLGIGEIIGIDNDYVEKTNKNRMIGIHESDVKYRRKKTDVMKRLVKGINSKIKFTSVFNKIPEQEAINQMKRADIVIGCVDSLFARHDIHELCLRYVIPYIDIGLLIRPERNESKECNIGGNVFTTIPGSICMYCWGFLSEDRLNEETNGKPRSYFLESQKQAQVVSFNGLLASAAVNEVLQLLTNFSNVNDDSFSVKKFDGIKNTLNEWEVKANPSCNSCKNQVAKGDPVWESVAM